jgi:hypothetical protein
MNVPVVVRPEPFSAVAVIVHVAGVSRKYSAFGGALL